MDSIRTGVYIEGPMLFRKPFLDGIRRGTVSVAFRRWRRPTVRSGGTLLTAAGELEIESVTPIDPNRISAADATRAGYDSRASLLADLNRRGEGSVYRIELGRLRPDPRKALRQTPVTEGEEFQDLTKRLQRLDDRAAEPWVVSTLSVIRDHSGVRAGDLCRHLGMEKEPFKINVRKLKVLGLTESLEIGYRLSPRGAAVLQRLLARAPRPHR
jgi:hypothetical protein